MSKKEFLNSLNDIVTDSIYISDNLENISEEINQNHWSFSRCENISEVEISDIELVISKIKTNRLYQINASNKEVDLIYYSWYDVQAGNFNFNLINANHRELPFGSVYKLVDSEYEIIENYLNDTVNDTLIVYQETIKKTKHNKA